MQLHNHSTAAAAAKGVIYSILLRLLSFSLSQITIRLIEDPRTLGYSSIQLELLCSTSVLFLSREGFRLSLVRIQSVKSRTKAGDNNERPNCRNNDNSDIDIENRAVDNVAWLTIPFGICLTICALMFHLHQCQTKSNALLDQNQQVTIDLYDYKLAGIYFSIATVIELLSEPCMIQCLRNFNVAIRAKAEGVASIGKALTTVLLLYLLQYRSDNYQQMQHHDLIGVTSSFAVAQIVYSIILSTVLYQQTKHELYIPSIWRLNVDQRLSFDPSSLKLSIIFTMQSVFKHLLTEGDRIILSTLVSSYNSGIYALVSSYGSIVSRMVLLPIEENGRLLFSHYHGQIAETAKHIEKEINVTDRKDDSNHLYQELKLQLSSSIQQLESTYITLVKLVLYIGFFFISFGSNYTVTLLQILAGSRWGSNKQAYHTLSIYCSYILCMAWNGMTEAFVYGVVDDSMDIGLLSFVHGIVGLVFYIIAPLLVLKRDNVNGTIGLIIANEICMVLRSIYSMNFAAKYFHMKKEMIQRMGNHYSKKENKQSALPRIVEAVKTTFSMSTISQHISSMYDLVTQVLPPVPVTISFAVSFKITQLSKNYFIETENESIVSLITISTLMHVQIGILFAMITIFNIYKYEKEFGGTLKAMLFTKHNAATSDKAKAD